MKFAQLTITTYSTGLAIIRNEILLILNEIRFITRKIKEDSKSSEETNDWKFAAMVIDRLCFWICSVYFVAGTFGIFFSAPHIFDWVSQAVWFPWLWIAFCLGFAPWDCYLWFIVVIIFLWLFCFLNYALIFDNININIIIVIIKLNDLSFINSIVYYFEWLFFPSSLIIEKHLLLKLLNY